MIKELLAKVSAKQDLTFDEAKQAIDEIMSGEIFSSRLALPRLACRYRAARIYALMVEAVSNSSSAPISTVWPCKSSTKTLILP